MDRRSLVNTLFCYSIAGDRYRPDEGEILKVWEYREGRSYNDLLRIAQASQSQGYYRAEDESAFIDRNIDIVLVERTNIFTHISVIVVTAILVLILVYIIMTTFK